MQEIVRALVGVQAQDRLAASLALRARGASSSASVEQALDEAGMIRTWAMRGTLHLVAADDLPLVRVVFGDVFNRRSERRLGELGLPAADAERSTAEAARVLAAEGPLTRHELAARLRERGVAVGEGQAPVAVVRRAALAGVLREVGRRGREELYGPLELGPLPDRDAALRELGRRYASAHAGAGPADLAAWTGVPAADVRTASDGLAAAPPPPVDPPPAPSVILLGAFDECLLGWASRDWFLAAEHLPAVAAGGILRALVLVRGRVAGTWRLDRRRRPEIAPLARIPPRALEREAAAVAAWLAPSAA